MPQILLCETLDFNCNGMGSAFWACQFPFLNWESGPSASSVPACRRENIFKPFSCGFPFQLLVFSQELTSNFVEGKRDLVHPGQRAPPPGVLLEISGKQEGFSR